MELPYAMMPSIGEPRRRRVTASFQALAPGEDRVLADMDGPGVITRLWFKRCATPAALLLKAFWDDEETPSIEVPLHDFLGFGGVLDLGLIRATHDSWSCLAPMPFLKRARIVLGNVGAQVVAPEAPIHAQVDYDAWQSQEMPDSPGMFHAGWNRERLADGASRRFCYLRARGHGAFLGTVLRLQPDDSSSDWRAAVGDLLFVDGEGRPRVVSSALAGHAFDAVDLTGQDQAGAGITAFCTHIHAPVVFRSSMLGIVGAPPGDHRSVSYWYQHEPHRDFAASLDGPCLEPGADLAWGARDVNARPQEEIEWLLNDGTRKAVSRHYLLDLHEFREAPGSPGTEARETLTSAFVSRETRSGQLYVSYSGHVRVVFNDRLVFERDRGDEFGLDPVAVMIPEGRNVVRLETTQSGRTAFSDWALGFRIASSEGRTIDGMEFETYPSTPLARP